MTDKLFSNLSKHRKNLKKNQTQVACFNRNFDKRIHLKPNSYWSSLVKGEKLSDYKYFKSLTIKDIMILRANLDINNSKHLFWCEKINRFLEFRFNKVNQRIKLNYSNNKQRNVFIQNVISLLLDYCHLSQDMRYLSIALKLLRKKTLVKQGIFKTGYSAQYSYNIVYANYLINYLSKSDAEDSCLDIA